MTIKLPVILIALTLVAVAGSGITYIVFSNHEASADAKVQQKSRDFFAPKERLPTEGGQEMKPRF